MDGGLELRPMQVPRDCDDVARICTACFPDWPLTGEEVAAAEARRLTGRWRVAWVAVAGRAVAGYGFAEEPLIAGRPGRLRVRVLVDAPFRGRGIASALYAELHRCAIEAGADELVTETQADDPRGPAFLARHGFELYHRRIESRLAMAEVAPAAVARGIDALTDRLFAARVRVATYRQLLLACADAPRRLYELDALLWTDVPFGLTGTVPSFEQYEAAELADPDFLPAATFVALDGGTWVGLCSLARGRGYLLNSITGVARPWRRRGLARWLKLHSLRWALESGATEIRTFNDGINDAIMALNGSLGFRPASVELRYRKELK